MHQVIVKVGAAAAFVGASVTPEAGKSAELDGPAIIDTARNEITINLKNVSDAQTLTITLDSMSAGGAAPINFAFPMMVMAGDTNEDTRVNVGDTNQTKERSGSLTASSNFRSDVNLDGRINVGDTNFVKARAGSPSPSPAPGRAANRR